MVNDTENVAVMTTEAPAEAASASASMPSTDKSLTPVQSAMERAKVVISEDEATAKPEKQAALAGDGTLSVAKDGKPIGDEAGTSASTPLEPSPYWDDKTVELFNALPSDDDKRVVAEAINHATKEQQAVFTKGMQSLAEEKKHLTSLVELQTHFGSNPRGVIEQLAAAAGMEVWFEPPPQPGEVPEFTSAAELAKWTLEQAKRDLRKETQAELQNMEGKRQKEAKIADFMGRLEQASRQYPDFLEHRDAIIDALQRIQGIGPHEAYQLATFGKHYQSSVELAETHSKLASLEKELKSLKAGLTRSPKAGHSGQAVGKENLSPVQAAMRVAQQKIAAEGAH